jgi:hypothetical protein
VDDSRPRTERGFDPLNRLGRLARASKRFRWRRCFPGLDVGKCPEDAGQTVLASEIGPFRHSEWDRSHDDHSRSDHRRRAPLERASRSCHRSLTSGDRCIQCFLWTRDDIECRQVMLLCLSRGGLLVWRTGQGWATRWGGQALIRSRTSRWGGVDWVVRGAADRSLEGQSGGGGSPKLGQVAPRDGGVR